MEPSKGFKEVISANLELMGLRDPLFAETLKKENKSIDECINYIIATVKSSGCNGFDDEEIFQMAKHYYDEDDIKNIKPVGGKVVINHTVQLSLEEINKAKEIAKERVIKEEMERMKKKPVVAKTEILKTETTELF